MKFFMNLNSGSKNDPFSAKLEVGQGTVLKIIQVSWFLSSQKMI